MQVTGSTARALSCKILQVLIHTVPVIARYRISRNMSGSPFVQRINVVTGTAEWYQEPEDYDYHQEVARSAYADMLHDHDRNMKYYRGLELAIRELHKRGEKAIVLDIGTGTGLLSMMAARLGADTIYACEAFAPMAKCAANVIKHNGFTEKIKLIPKRSTELEVGLGKDLSTRANVLVTEVFDTELIGEGAIGTYNHAHEVLLEEGSFVIPTKAIYYAQVVNCPLVADWNTLKSIKLHNGVTINFAKNIAECPGVPSVHDVQLSEIKPDQFTKISEPIPIFEFDWAEHSKRLPIKDVSSKLFTAKASEACTAIFTWWDLQMSTLEDHSFASNIITMKPIWAGNDAVWRDHWMQAIYYNPRPIQLTKDITYNLVSFHDEYSFWFDIQTQEAANNISSSSLSVQSPICTCGVHVALSRSNLGLFNDLKMREKYIEIITPLINPETVAFVLSEGSSLPFILAGLGAAKVFVQERNGFSKRVMGNLVSDAKFQDKIFVVESLKDNLLKGITVDIIIGDPFFHDAVLPWHNISFWYSSQKLKQFLSPNVKIFPCKAILRGVAVEYRDLWKIRSNVGKVCNGDFDIVDFDNLIHNSSEISDSVIDSQPLWEYPSITSSHPFTLLTFDFTNGIECQSSKGSVPIVGNPNGISLWMEWCHVTDDGKEIVISTGPIKDSSDIVPNESVQWDLNCKQGVYFFPTQDSQLNYSSIHYNAKFSSQNGNIEFSFKKQSLN